MNARLGAFGCQQNIINGMEDYCSYMFLQRFAKKIRINQQVGEPHSGPTRPRPPTASVHPLLRQIPGAAFTWISFQRSMCTAKSTWCPVNQEKGRVFNNSQLTTHCSRLYLCGDSFFCCVLCFCQVLHINYCWRELP